MYLIDVDDKSERVVKTIINDLRGRKGFNAWFDHLNSMTQREIINELIEVTKKELIAK